MVLNVATGAEYTADAAAVRRYRDGRPLTVRATVPLAERLIATGFSYEADQREVQARALVRLLPRIRDIRRFGACSLDLCGVAEGSLDGYVEEGVNLWDHAAGGLVARPAGARVETDRGAGGRLHRAGRSGGRIRRVPDCGCRRRGTLQLTTPETRAGAARGGNSGRSPDVQTPPPPPVCPFPG